MPRCLWSVEDAMYCARFLAKLAETNTAGFSMALTYDHICRDVIPVIRCCTDQEASNLIVFTKEVRAAFCGLLMLIERCTAACRLSSLLNFIELFVC